MKSKIIAYVVVLLAIFALFFVGCQKSNVMSVQEDNKLPKRYFSSSYTPLDFSDLGETHNNLIKNAYSSVNFASPTIMEDIEVFFTEVAFDYYSLGLSENDWKDLLIDINSKLKAINFDLRNSTDLGELNIETANFIFEILDKCENLQILSEFNLDIDSILNSASNELTNLDFDIVKASAIIAKKSAELWAPTSIGGEGLFDTTFGNNPQLRGGWRGALIGDVAGASQYFLGLGITASITAAAIPGTNAILVIGLGVSVGLNSAYGALF